MRERKLAGLVAAAACVIAAAVAAPAQATVNPTLYAPANCSVETPEAAAASLTYTFCDDGVPAFGGATVNATGASAITVPGQYMGADSFSGLPAKDTSVVVPGADPTSHEIALDVDVSMPKGPSPAAGYPMIVMMHGCCSGDKKSWESTSGSHALESSGEKYHYNNAWYASRGYVVVTYTARGFVNGSNGGSTGETQLNSRSYEINDYQSLACQVFANQAQFATAAGNTGSTIDPSKVVATGGSYGGGFAWLALTDPKWTCNSDTGASGTNMSLAAAAPRYGWTNLLYTLVPTGTHSNDPVAPGTLPNAPGGLPRDDGCDSGPRDLMGNLCAAPQTPVGVPKGSILNLLYSSGTGALGGSHTTFGSAITNSFLCLKGTYPPDPANPLCTSTLTNTLPEFMRERSAYYQNQWFTDIATDATKRVPIFNAGTFSDPLFPSYENRSMVNRILSVVPGYPVKQYYGDYEHFVQNKAKEWGDSCGTAATNHVCTFADFPGGDPTGVPATRIRTGVTTRLNAFIDHYALGTSAAGDITPDVTASLQACPVNAASLGVNPDEPGPTSTAATFEGLTPNQLAVDMPGNATTTSTAGDTQPGLDADPATNFIFRGGSCYATQTSTPGAGIASYTSNPLPTTETMFGSAKVTVNFSATPANPQGFQLNARLYDVAPDGTANFVDRGPRRLSDAEIASGTVSYELHGNGWRFAAGHRIRVEIAQDDSPYVNASSFPSSAMLTRAHLDIPVVESSGSIGGGSDAKPPSGGSNPPGPSATGQRAKALKKCKKKKKKLSAKKYKKCKKKAKKLPV